MKTEEEETKPEHAQRWLPLQKLALALLVMAALIMTVDIFHVPNPNMILITGLVVFTALYGFPAGILCAVLMLLYSLYFFSTDHSMIHFTSVNARKMMTILLGVVLNTLFVGKLKQREDAAVMRLKAANQLLAEDNILLEKASMVDTLTGVRNRFALERDASLYERRSLCLTMMDVDNFKKVNDTYGHKTGDLVLSSLGEALNVEFGAEHCYRYGGDEFLVVGADMDPEDFGRRLRKLTNKLSERLRQEEQLNVTFSAGYVFGRAEVPGELQLMQRHADRKLYEAKRVGKNRCLGERFRPSISERFAIS